MGQLKLDDMRQLKLGIENAHYWLLDILDYDRLARYFDPKAKVVGRAILTEYLNGRNAAAASLYNYFTQGQEADGRFSTSLLSLPKGAAFFSRVLRLNQVGDLTPFALTGLCALADFYKRTARHSSSSESTTTTTISATSEEEKKKKKQNKIKNKNNNNNDDDEEEGDDEGGEGLSYEDATLRRAYEQILHHIAFHVRSLSAQQVTDVLMDLAQLPAAAWLDLVTVPETRAAVTGLVERGIALGLHHFEESAVVAALGIDQTNETSMAKTCWSQCIAIIVGLFTSIFMERLQALSPPDEDEEEDEAAAAALQREQAGEPMPGTVLEFLILLLRTDVPPLQKEYLSQVLFPLIECGGFEFQSEEARYAAEVLIKKELQQDENNGVGGGGEEEEEEEESREGDDDVGGVENGGFGDGLRLPGFPQDQQFMPQPQDFPFLGVQQQLPPGIYQNSSNNNSSNNDQIPQELSALFPNLQHFQNLN